METPGYIITEQGDLGLGLTPIEEGTLPESEDKKKDKDEKK